MGDNGLGERGEGEEAIMGGGCGGGGGDAGGEATEASGVGKGEACHPPIQRKNGRCSLKLFCRPWKGGDFGFEC